MKFDGSLQDLLKPGNDSTQRNTSGNVPLTKVRPANGETIKDKKFVVQKKCIKLEISTKVRFVQVSQNKILR
ncbi:hypothetical protein HNY73_004181 [Argiope bruennichi]|uniref:Uncharacterized protein n=1 Tax=Argiope bruennichi TaxID=94029 RepID=A0A8T0FN37_ARGBR|nr:hypothetical protein HNY73_004181 [Argiope bruennichi]